MSNELYHYGIKRRSGRYPYGSGERPFQGDKDPLRQVSELNSDMNKWEYGVLINGKKITDPNQINWKDYKTTPIENVKKYKVGVCWDFVNYQHSIFKKEGIKDKSYFFVMERNNNPNDLITHTFSIVDLKNGKYWYESAWMKHQGINKVSSFEDVINVLLKDYGTNSYEVYEYNPEGLDQNLSNSDFFKRATETLVKSKQIKHSVKNINIYFVENIKTNPNDVLRWEKNMNELYHHGRKGQQWGVSNGPPYPLNRKGLSYYFKKNKGTKEDRKRIKEEEETKKRQAYEEELEKNKDKVLRSGKASDILKYQGRLTNQELQSAVSRLNLEKTLKDYSSKEKQDSLRKMNDMVKTLDTVTNWTNTGIKAWNTIANISNSLSSSEKKLPVINTGGGKGKKEKK